MEAPVPNLSSLSKLNSRIFPRVRRRRKFQYSSGRLWDSIKVCYMYSNEVYYIAAIGGLENCCSLSDSCICVTCSIVFMKAS